VNLFDDRDMIFCYFQLDAAVGHTSNQALKEIRSFIGERIISKDFGHPDLQI
jgi:hypothetical protein